jgi:transposase InsO family protein
VAKTTIATTLKNNGIAPSPDRSTTWKTFLKSHADVIAAADFFTVDVWTKRGLVTHYVFFVIHHATRMVEIAGVTPHPDGNFMAQVARNLTDSVDGFLRGQKYLILDTDSLFTKQFVRILKDAGTKVVHTAIQAPNMNAVAERSVGSVKRECLSKLILLGDHHLQRVLSNYATHYNQDRPHQSLDNNLIQSRLRRILVRAVSGYYERTAKPSCPEVGSRCPRSSYARRSRRRRPITCSKSLASIQRTARAASVAALAVRRAAARASAAASASTKSCTSRQSCPPQFREAPTKMSCKHSQTKQATCDCLPTASTRPRAAWSRSKTCSPVRASSSRQAAHRVMRFG